MNITDLYNKSGFAIIRQAFDAEYLKKFINFYQSKIDLITDNSLSYLGSRESFQEVEEIRELLCGETINAIFNAIGLNMMLIVAEARVASSRISWHRDVTWPTDGPPQYAVISIALEDPEPGSGLVEYIPGSHLWEVDYNIVGRDKIVGNGAPGYDYYSDLIEQHNAKMQSFESKAGDVLVWNGNMVHRGACSKVEGARRHSLTGHYVSASPERVQTYSNLGYHRTQ